MTRPYFTPTPGAPPPLRITVERQVRFEEVDPLNIVWHGRYPSYFEDARVAFGEKYGLGYLECYERGIVTPIKKMHVDYFRPLAFPDRFTVEGILHFTTAARLNFEFVIRNQAGEVTCTGYTVQMMLDKNQEIMLVPPPFIEEFLERWRQGALS
ncbi:acyl-CoA thioesterase [Geomonas propionica]|uniref:Acyl-CoA thioesterase n=1 Tax=Geomonas propionica TaxID=2798582 RepID=A0ABS0YKV2_9BACT|nr:acyl-CoA thioesterase [Geomonas propionica]MBJ6798600.1 acyl-CoA thioesterase [Geomonas propionica]